MERTIENSILSTLAYYDALGKYPLTVFEIYRYLKNPFDKRDILIGFNRIKDILDKSQRLKQLVSCKNGFYYLNSKEDRVKQRIEHQKIADRKWKKTRRIVKWFQLVPYLRMAAVSGSLSLSNTRKESDLDLLITAKYGRIWTTRMLLSALTQLLGQRRHGRIINDKICLNQYMADKYPEIIVRNMSNAQSCFQLVPLLGLAEFSEFIKRNNWVKHYLYFYQIESKNHARTIKESKILKTIACSMEWLLDNRIGDFIEQKLGDWQKKRIINKTKVEYIAFDIDKINREKNKAHLCLSSKGLIFHYPISRNMQVESEYLNKARDLNCG